MTQTSAVFVTEAILLTNRWSTRGEPILSLALASPPSEWDPNRGPEAPTVHCGFSKAPYTAQVEVLPRPVFREGAAPHTCPCVAPPLAARPRPPRAHTGPAAARKISPACRARPPFNRKDFPNP